MPRMVYCVKLKRELPGLDKPPFPGELGQRIYEHISQQAYNLWPAQSTQIISQQQLNMGNPQSRQILRKEMEKFFFGDAATGAGGNTTQVERRMVYCVKLERELPGLDKPPFPGALGQRIYEQVSKQAWDMWPAQSTLIINHYGLNMADPEARKVLREQMEDFFFGPTTKMPEGWEPEAVGASPSRKGGGGGASRKKMRDLGEILLISCYELGHQPFHLASLSAMLQQAGYQPVSVDTAIEALSDEVISMARFVGISVPMHTALRLGEQIAQRVRATNPSAHICLYGLYALLNADHLLQETIDYAIGGEYEVPLLKLVKALEQGKHTPLPSVCTRTAKSGPSMERTSFVIPERNQLPGLERYARLQWNDELRIAGYTETTRGCKHTCLHCPITPIYHGRFFAIPAKVVLADIHAQVVSGAARHITFGDPDFWNGPTHAIRIIRALHQEFPDVTFDATIKIEHLLKYRHLLPEMKELGCAFIVSAVESLNDTVLKRLDKGHTSQDIATTFAMMEQVGIPLRPSLLPFSPWETLESYITLLDFFEKHHLIEHIDPVHLSIRLLIPPGSALLDTPDSQNWVGTLDSAAYTYRWQHPDPRMDELQAQVATLVETTERTKADPVQTFFLVKALALATQGQDFSVSSALQHYGPQKVLPHLTETWFC